MGPHQIHQYQPQLTLCRVTLVHSLISLGENRVQAHKYLLSTVCADLVTRIVRFVAEDYMIPLDVQEVTLTSEV